MIRSNVLMGGVVALCLGFGLAACGDDGGGGGGDECAGLTLCTVVGTTCSGTEIVTCTENADGCLVETVDQDCNATGQACDDTGAAPMCTGCSDDTECVGASDGDSLCSGDSTVTCNVNTEGCLTATVNDCTATGRICDDAGASAACVDDCTDDPRCTSSSAGDTSCDSNNLLTCTVVPGGCLVASVHNCELFGGTCDAAATPAPACTAASCTDHPLCAGLSNGDSACSGDFLNTCNTGADGCLALTQVGCGPGTCDATGTPVCTTPAETGEDCANAFVVTNTTTFTNADITAFADDLTFTDASCQMRTGVSDVVFRVDLADGETLDVAEFGGADTVVNLQVGTCGQALVCVASQDDPDTSAQSYTATGAETVYITVETFAAMPTTTDIAVSITIDQSCGNGIVEPGEGCDDDGVVPGDGCSATCTVEFGFSCDQVSPTSCAALVSIGSFDASAPIADVVNPGALPAGFRDTFLITFNEDVLLNGTLTVPGMGDPDFFLVNMNNAAVINSAVDGPETFSGFVPAGTYMAIVEIFGGADAANQGYVLSLNTSSIPTGGTIGDGDNLSLSGGPLSAGSSEFYSITVTEDVLLTFDLTSDDGMTSDMDLFISGAGGFVTSVADDFNETGVSVALPAGTYVFDFNAYVEVAGATTWNFTATATALTATSIGSFAAAAAIPVTNGGPLAQRVYDHYEITFTEDVLLSGTLDGNTTGETGVFIYDANQNYVSSFAAGDETLTDVALPAGTYIVQILTISETFGGGDVDAYALTLSTTAP